MIKTRSFLQTWLDRIVQERAIVLIALLQFALHIWVAAHDNFFRDELYYIAASRHLDFGFVEFPPMVAVLAAAARTVMGSSLVALRLLPAVSGVVAVLVTADMVAVLGGGRLARVLAAFAVAVGPVFIGSTGLMSMDPFDQMWWTLCAWTLVRLIKDQQPRLWLRFGLFAGLGLLTKLPIAFYAGALMLGLLLSNQRRLLFGVFAGLGLLTKLPIAFYAGALMLGLLLSNQRRLLFNRWLVFGGLIALVLVSPYILWNARHGFPVVEYTRRYSNGKTFAASPIEYFFQQMITANPLALPLWLGGLYFLFFTKPGQPYRAFGWAYLFLYVFFMLQRAKFYWLSPAYPALFACAAYGLELWVQQRPRLGWLPPSYTWTVAISGLLLVPFAIPILPVETFIRVNALMGGTGTVKTENLTSSVLPQNFADRYGWPELATAVKAAYDTLTPQEKAEACVLASNYGEAGAVDFFGAELGLPKAISGHNSYYIWGPQGCTGKVLITVGYPLTDLVTGFESVEVAGKTSCTYCMPYENGAPILIARGLKIPIDQAWPTVKSFN